MLKEHAVFYTGIYYTKILSDLDKVRDKVLELSKNTDGVTVSNRIGWQSPVVPEGTHDFMKTIISIIRTHMAKVCIDNGMEESYNISYWFNVNGTGAYNVAHNHPDCQWSAVLYLNAPQHSGDLSFYRPNIEQMVVDFVTDRNSLTYSITPESNQLVFFPAWLVHEVGINQTKEQRVSIAFNIQKK